METPFKHLYRSTANKVLTGVCGGLGEYWNIDPVILRLFWLLVTIFTGFFLGVIAYLIATFIIPQQSVEVIYEDISTET